MQHLNLFLQINWYDFYHFLKFDYGRQLLPFVRLVFTYNLIVWFDYTLRIRRQYRRLIFTQPSSLLSLHHLGQELTSLVRPLYQKDAHSLGLRREYLLYLAFLTSIALALIFFNLI